MLVLSLVCLAFGLVPSLLFCINLGRYSRPAAGPTRSSRVSILIPARNEEAAIGAAVMSILNSALPEMEVIVMDDNSTDGTAAVVSRLALSDERLRLASSPPLPSGWNGKQHACWMLAQAARYDVFCFIDADVRLQPEALSRLLAFMGRSDASLVSGFPQQSTGTTLEWMLLPLIHFVLLGFLPLGRMRSGTNPSFAAGCGQLMMVRRDAYFEAGGHAGIRTTMHDGLRLPRLLREHGYRTDLADLTELATCRMYNNASQVWQGLAKNATEGLAAPARIVPITAALLLGQVAPFVLLCCGIRGAAFWITISACVAALLPRVLGVRRFRQDWRGALLHPIGIFILLVVQWYALLRELAGAEVTWKARAYQGQ